jgi:hypothetical protein
MAKDDGLGLDFPTQVVNVQWGSGLAVDFGDRDQDAPKPDKPKTQ